MKCAIPRYAIPWIHKKKRSPICRPIKRFIRARKTRKRFTLKTSFLITIYQVGEFTIYNDFLNDPRDFEKKDVLYHYPVNRDKLVIGKFCSIPCGAKFLFNSANHTLSSLSTYPFPIFYEEWGLDVKDVGSAWDVKGDITIGNDVWIGYEAAILAGVTIGDGAIIGARALVTKDVPPYTIVGGTPAKEIRKRFDEKVASTLQRLKWWDWPAERIAANLPAIQRGDLMNLKQNL